MEHGEQLVKLTRAFFTPVFQLFTGIFTVSGLLAHNVHPRCTTPLSYFLMMIYDRRYSICSVVRITAAVLAVIVGIYNVHVFWTMSLHQNGSSLTCDYSDDNYFMMYVFEYLKLISYCVVPFVIVTILNTCIIVRLRRTASLQRMDSVSIVSSTNTTTRRSSSRRRYFSAKRSTTSARSVPLSVTDDATTAAGLISSSEDRPLPSCQEATPVDVLVSGPQQPRQRRLTRMLLIVSFAWLLLSAPFALHSLAANFVDSDHERFADRNLLAKIICFLLVYVNHAINFLCQETTSKSSQWKNDWTWLDIIYICVDLNRSQLIHGVMYLLLTGVNHAINFYLYCLTGSRFREELCALFHCRSTAGFHNSRMARSYSKRGTSTRRQNDEDLELENIMN